MEVNSKTKQAFTLSQLSDSLTEQNNSTLTYHAAQNNLVINWTKARAVFCNQGSVEPKGSMSTRQGFRWWPVINTNKAEINNKVRVTSNLSYFGHMSLFFIWATISVTHIHLYQSVFFCANYQVQKNAGSVCL